MLRRGRGLIKAIGNLGRMILENVKILLLLFIISKVLSILLVERMVVKQLNQPLRLQIKSLIISLHS